MDSKVCRKCGDLKSFDMFGRQASTKDGYKYFCKECISKINRNRYDANKERHISVVKSWQEKHPEKVKKYKQDYLKRVRNAEV